MTPKTEARLPPSIPAAARVKLALSGHYGPMLLAFLLAAAWLAVDLLDGRDRILAEKARLAAEKSQFMSQWFGTTIVSADYVLSDLLGRIPAASEAGRLRALLEEKAATLPGVVDLVVYDRNCVFTAAARRPVDGQKNRQTFCGQGEIPVKADAYVEYMAGERSVFGGPAILVARNRVSAEGLLLGGVLAVIDLAAAQEWLALFPVEGEDVIALIDTKGTLLAHMPPRPQWIGIRPPPPPHQPAFDDSRSSVTVIDVSPFDGRERVLGLSKIERIPIIIIVGFDKEGALGEWRRRAWQIAAGSLAMLALLALAALRHYEVLRQREDLRLLATTDSLTGVANRRQLMQIALHEVGRALRYGSPLALLVIDIDHFKAVNDTWGHPAGDSVIVNLAKMMTAVVRDQDTVGRLGGEEFAIILPETDCGGAVAIAERLRVMVESAAGEGESAPFTISIGVAAHDGEESDLEGLLSRADTALYRAKDGGRNRVMAQ
jgi:diguanylate cyclase (GGDEF)-like protein